ncbi:SprT family zinc-dependent metalloprotease [Streptomyces castrisilvae]|uniref:SprT family zinc-dependent metalloprotease n=1 Tax=Streptomyces castrisilvae TaxID=3033811 RepID=A0ABY9HJP2_9ACTN|nr:SprT family zinc-dependent metalloprotease [Streptomyces sp. Mut1]WLQ34705.1 SprT family zinc-dependent metalloprotease [Streptomyces sp. Mut1]
MPTLPDAASVSDEPLLTEDGVLFVDGRELGVRISLRRRRLGLTVERDRSLTLHVPKGCGVRRAEDFVRSSAGWIDAKARLSEERRQLHPTRSLRDGEIHRYLGRDYRLLVVDAPPDEGQPVAAVRLVAGRLRLDSGVAADPVLARRALADWYGRAGQRWIQGRLQPWAARMDLPEPTVRVRDLGHRWGSYRAGSTDDGTISLHWAVFQLPMHLVDYVVAHELAHVRVPGHAPEYWRLLGRALPECRRLKTELDELGRRVWMGDLD